MLHKIMVLMCVFILSLFSGCDKNTDPVSSYGDRQGSTTKTYDTGTSESNDNMDGGDETYGSTEFVKGETHEDPGDYTLDDTNPILIALDEYTITVTGTGVSTDGAIATITAAGTYSISGTLANGQIVVDTDDDGIVTLILKDASISSSSDAPLYIKNAEKTVVVLADGTENRITDNAPVIDYVERITGVADENAINAALFCASDLTIYGDGTLIVKGNSADGITSKDGLIITSGTIMVIAEDDGIRGKDYLVIEDGDITVNAGGDGLKSDNANDTSLGYVSIENGIIDVTAGGDAITAETGVLVSGGIIYLTSGGGSSYSVAEDFSAKGIKSGASIVIDSVTLTIDSADDGINTNDSITIKTGTINISSGDEGINSKNALIIESGDITVTADGDGLKSVNDENAAQGHISIMTGIIEISTDGDAISAGATVFIKNGNFMLISGDGSSHTITADASAKGIKGVISVTIDGGTFIINSADDAVHSNGTVTINDGTFTISTGDDGVHADTELEVNGGDIDIIESYEGLESTDLTINNGTIHIIASDDGINGAGGVDQSGIGGWDHGWFPQGNCSLTINGGYIVVTAVGDGLDINGSMTMTDGDVIINGPTSNFNSAIDYDGSFAISNGSIIGAGSSGMAQTADTSSSQYSVLINFSSALKAGTLFALVSSSGDVIVCMKPIKTYQSIAFSSPELSMNTTYNVYTGGSSTGTLIDSLYEGGTYTPGTHYTSFTISSIVTTIGGGFKG